MIRPSRQAIVLIRYFSVSLFVPPVAAGAGANGTYPLRDGLSVIESNDRTPILCREDRCRRASLASINAHSVGAGGKVESDHCTMVVGDLNNCPGGLFSELATGGGRNESHSIYVCRWRPSAAGAPVTVPIPIWVAELR